MVVASTLQDALAKTQQPIISPSQYSPRLILTVSSQISTLPRWKARPHANVKIPTFHPPCNKKGFSQQHSFSSSGHNFPKPLNSNICITRSLHSWKERTLVVSSYIRPANKMPGPGNIPKKDDLHGLRSRFFYSPQPYLQRPPNFYT